MCVCVCVDCYSCSVINKVKVRASIGLLSRFLGFQFVDLQTKALLSIMASFAYVEKLQSPDSYVAKYRDI